MLVELPWPPRELSPNSRKHWAVRAKKKKAYGEVCYWSAKECASQFPRCHVRFHDGNIPMEITFYPPDKRKRDADNMLASIKAAVDGVALAWKINDVRFRPITINIGEVVKRGKVTIGVKNVRHD